MSNLSRLILEQIDKELDVYPDVESSVEHLRHIFEGYRARILDEDECPYTPGTRNHISWVRGWAIAGADARTVELHDKRS
jgi:ribosome modulation factor